MNMMKLFCLAFVLMFVAVACERKLTKLPEHTKTAEPTEPTLSLRKAPADGDLGKQKDSLLRPKLKKHGEKYVYKQAPQGELAIYVHFPEDWTADDKRPAIVFFFGGGWTVGTVKEFTPQAEYLAGRGMVAARADYRVNSRHGTMADKCVEDAKSTVRWLRANAVKLGIDPNRIAASGESSGGHIAACTGTIKGLEAEGEDLSISSKPNLIVLFKAVLDTSRLPLYLVSEEMAIKISPCHNLTKGVPPAILFCGTEDKTNVEAAVEFIDKCKKLGNIVELYTAEGQTHGSLFSSPWLENMIFLMDRFLAKYGYTQGEPTIKLPEEKVEMKKITPISLKARDSWDYIPLHREVRHGHKEPVELLIANGADVNYKDRLGRTPLYYAARHGHKELVELLIANGADVNSKDRLGCTPLYQAARHPHKEVVELLAAKGADITTIHLAALVGNLEKVRSFIEAGAHINAKDENGHTTPLHWAAYSGHSKVVQLLLANGANIDAKTKWDLMPLHYAASGGHKSVVELFLDKGNDVNAKAWSDLTPLHDAAWEGHKEVAELLIARGADVTAKDKEGRTPLWYAKSRGHTEIVELLRKYGAEE